MSQTTEIRQLNTELISKSYVIGFSIPKESAALERELAQTKWFDYRFMSPLDATTLFASIYQQIYRRKWSVNFATAEASMKIGIRGNNWRSSPRELTSFWNARQSADYLGVPYEVFIEHVMEFRLRANYRKPPRPNQFYGSKYLEPQMQFVWRNWIERCESMDLAVSKLPQYRVENYAGTSAQIDHQDWIVRQLRQRHAGPGSMSAVCFEDPVLDPTIAGFEFGPRRMEVARDRFEAAGSRVSVAPPIALQELRPSCFGIVHAFEETSSQCSGCIAARDCRILTEAVRKLVMKHYKSDDVVAAKARQKNSARQQRFRDRQRAARLSKGITSLASVASF